MKALKTCIDIIRGEYAIALLYDKDEAKAQKHLAAFEKAAKNYAYTGELEEQWEMIAMIQENAKNWKRRGSTPPFLLSKESEIFPLQMAAKLV